MIDVAPGINSANWSRSKEGQKIIRPWAASVMLVATNKPWVWKTGRACSRTSLAVKRQQTFSACALEIRFPWVNIAPFERPVVPEV